MTSLPPAPLPLPQSPTSEIDLSTLMSGENGAYVEALFEDYLAGRTEIPESWRVLFAQLLGTPPTPIAAANANGSLGHANGSLQQNGGTANGSPQGALASRGLHLLPGSGLGMFGLVDAYRSLGHTVARLDPLGRGLDSHPLLDPERFGIQPADLDVPGPSGHFLGLDSGTPREVIAALRETYCGTFAVEFMEMRDRERRDWLIQKMEPTRNHPQLEIEERRRTLERIVAAEKLEQFLHKRFLGQKRFSVEGCDTLIPLFETIVEDGSKLGAGEMVVGMAHRGRLNFLTHVMGMPYRALFGEYQQGLIPLDAQGSGDVKYHRGYSSDRQTLSGKPIHLSLQPNPSHLEVVNPVVEGIVRCKQNILGDSERNRVIPILIHGDAAFMGQGVVAETLAMSELDIYWTGGTVHIIVNNQIGFTTNPEDYRFTQHPTDMAKAIQAPVFHVNADDPEAVVHAARLAIEFRQVFQEDVIINLVGYRRHGHNEGEDPTLTQPLLYKQIKSHPTVGTLYAKQLVEASQLSQSEVDGLIERQNAQLEAEFEESQNRTHLEGAEGYRGRWSGHETSEIPEFEQGETRVDEAALKAVGEALRTWPATFHPHRKLQRLMQQRCQSIQEGGPIDWGTGEALALGTILAEGRTIRMTGQDIEPGTFGHRHAVLHDVENGSTFTPLASTAKDGAQFIVKNSLLSEVAVLGFEFGYSTVDPNRLVVWEAQFGDFANGAQVVIDQFIAGSEQKWNRSSGLVMLLPHGYEGQGPEHSSARLERFLQLCAEDNMQVVNLTTPAQLFHALRRQLTRSFRKPLVVMSPKSLLRHPRCTSPLQDFVHGSFQAVIDDPEFAQDAERSASARRVLLCSGKVYYSLLAAREDAELNDVAIVRLEEIHPFPFQRLHAVLSRYPTQDVVWVQEEPWNMGSWSFIHERLKRVVADDTEPRYVGRREAASPAAGSYRLHEQEENDFVREAFARDLRTPIAR